MQRPRTLGGGPVQPGVDLADPVRQGAPAVFGGAAQRPFLVRRAQGAGRRRLDGFGLARRLETLAGEAGFRLELAGEDLALVDLGAQPLHFIPVLAGLITVLVEGGRAGTRLPCLRDLRLGGRGGEQQDGGEGANGDHGRKMGPEPPVAKRGLDEGGHAAADRVQTRVRLTAESSSSRVVGTAYSASRSKPSFGK